MYLTHYFAHPETLTRAQYWLTRLGFQLTQVEIHPEGRPAISLRATPSEAAKAELLFAALEASDPDGAPGFWHSRHLVHASPEPLRIAESLPPVHGGVTVVGWHPVDQGLLEDPRLRSIHEALASHYW